MADRTITQSIIVLEVPGGTFSAAVTCGVDAALKEMADAYREQRYAQFTVAISNKPVRIRPDVKVLVIYEQDITITDDPRKAGQTRTPGGLVLPQ